MAGASFYSTSAELIGLLFVVAAVEWGFFSFSVRSEGTDKHGDPWSREISLHFSQPLGPLALCITAAAGVAAALVAERFAINAAYLDLACAGSLATLFAMIPLFALLRIRAQAFADGRKGQPGQLLTISPLLLAVAYVALVAFGGIAWAVLAIFF